MVLTWVEESIADAAEQLRFDEELLAAGQGVARVWEIERECVVLGRGGIPERDVRGGAEIFRRESGGGAVALAPGCLNYSLVIPFDAFPRCRDVSFSMRWILGRMVRALDVPGLACAGISDLALHGRKVSGNAQHRTRGAILHHGTLLYAFEGERAERLLADPVRAPEYRAGRGHEEFLTNLPLERGEIVRRLRKEWCGE
ncbi:MAG: hypothetical protein U0Q16_20025 [Bryobacteraceae bacterium]